MNSIIDQLQHIKNSQPSVLGVLHPPVSLDEVQAAERQLGFSLPNTLRRIYAEVANGGIGPGKGGITGLPGGATDGWGRSIIEDYREYTIYATDPIEQTWDTDDPERFWIKGMLSICHYGCSIWSCVWCTQPNAPVVRHDGNIDPEYIQKHLEQEQIFKGSQYFNYGCWIEASSFDKWLQAWIDGRNMEYIGYPSVLRPLGHENDPKLWRQS